MVARGKRVRKRYHAANQVFCQPLPYSGSILRSIDARRERSSDRSVERTGGSVLLHYQTVKGGEWAITPLTRSDHWTFGTEAVRFNRQP